MTKRTIVMWFAWSLDIAKGDLGQHTGGPYERGYRRHLASAERALKALSRTEFKKGRR